MKNIKSFFVVLALLLVVFPVSTLGSRLNQLPKPVQGWPKPSDLNNHKLLFTGINKDHNLKFNYDDAKPWRCVSNNGSGPAVSISYPGSPPITYPNPPVHQTPTPTPPPVTITYPGSPPITHTKPPVQPTPTPNPPSHHKPTPKPTPEPPSHSKPDPKPPTVPTPEPPSHPKPDPTPSVPTPEGPPVTITYPGSPPVSHHNPPVQPKPTPNPNPPTHPKPAPKQPTVPTPDPPSHHKPAPEPPVHSTPPTKPTPNPPVHATPTPRPSNPTPSPSHHHHHHTPHVNPVVHFRGCMRYLGASELCRREVELSYHTGVFKVSRDCCHLIVNMKKECDDVIFWFKDPFFLPLVRATCHVRI